MKDREPKIKQPEKIPTNAKGVMAWAQSENLELTKEEANQIVTEYQKKQTMAAEMKSSMTPFDKYLPQEIERMKKRSEQSASSSQNLDMLEVAKFDLNINETHDTASIAEKIIEICKKQNLNLYNLVFRGIDGDRPRLFSSKEGDEHGEPVIFASGWGKLKLGYGSDEGEEGNPIQYALKFDNPAIAVYAENELDFSPKDEEYSLEGEFAYMVKDKKALKFVIFLKNLPLNHI
jgi:hypothetical protein